VAVHGVLDPRLLAAAGVVLLVVLALYLTFSGFAMVGITPLEVTLLLFVAPFLAAVNLPVWSVPGAVIGINLAGLGVPLFLSIRFLAGDRLPAWKGLVGAAVITALAHELARVAPEQGILVPALPLVVASALVGAALAGTRWHEVGPATYVSGSIGTLVGADLLNLNALADPSREEPLVAVIGGAGTLDAIFLISLWAVVATILGVAVARLVGAAADTGSG